MTPLALSASPAPEPGSFPGSKPTAVVIDDSITARTFLRVALQKAGFEVVAEGERGDQALSLYERFRPTLITLDIVMPILDGVSAARALLQQFPQAAVIMCSSLSAREKIMACREIGVRHFILKPLVSETVIKIVQGILESLGGAPGEAEAAP